MATISGDFGTVNIPDFALDSTLQALLAEQNETRAAMQNNTASIDGLGGYISNTNATTNAGNKIQSGIRSTLIKTQRQAQAQNRTQASLLQRVVKGLKTGGAAGITQTLRTGDMSSLLNNLGVFGSALQKGIDILGDYRNSLQNLSNVGQGFGKSILDTQTQIGKLGMGLSEFERVVTRSGTAIANLGGNSAVEFAKLSSDVRKVGFEFGNYGLKITEINDFLAQNLEIERMSGAVGKEASDNAAAAFNTLAKETTLQSIQTGRDRKAMMRAALEARSSENFLAAVRQEEAAGNTEAAKNMRQNLDDVSSTLSAMFGPELAGQLVDSITTGVAEGRGIEATEIGRQFLAAGGPAAEALQKIALNFKDFSPDEVGDLLMDFQDQIEERAEGIKDLGRLANVNEGFGLLRSLFVNLTRVEDLSTEEIEARLKERAESTKAGTNLLKSEELVNRGLVAAQAQLADIALGFAGRTEFLQDNLIKAVQNITDTLNGFSIFGTTGKSGPTMAGGARSLEEKGFIAGAAGFREFGRQGALQAESMSQALEQKGYSTKAGEVFDAQGNKLAASKDGIFKTADGDEFKVIGDKLVPTKRSISQRLIQSGGKFAGKLGAGGLAIQAAIDAYGIEGGTGENINRLTRSLSEEGLSEDEKKRINDEIKQERAKYYSQYARLLDTLILGAGGGSIGGILGAAGGPLGSIGGAIGGGYAGASLAESGVGPLQWLANMLGVDPDELKNTDRSKLLKRIKKADSESETGQESNDNNSVSQNSKITNELLGALIQATEFQTATLKRGLGSQKLVS